MKYSELVKKAIETIENNDDLFIELVNELDSWNGFADCYRCYDMYELDELLFGKTPTEILSEVCNDFNVNDNYFYWDIWGIHSTDYIIDVYRDNTSAEEVFDNVLEHLNDIYISDSDFEDLMNEIDEMRTADETEEE